MDPLWLWRFFYAIWANTVLASGCGECAVAVVFISKRCRFAHCHAKWIQWTLLRRWPAFRTYVLPRVFARKRARSAIAFRSHDIPKLVFLMGTENVCGSALRWASILEGMTRCQITACMCVRVCFVCHKSRERTKHCWIYNGWMVYCLHKQIR